MFVNEKKVALRSHFFPQIRLIMLNTTLDMVQIYANLKEIILYEYPSKNFLEMKSLLALNFS